MNRITRTVAGLLLATAIVMTLPAFNAHAQADDACAELPAHDALREVLQQVVSEDNAGFGLNMWATVVNRDGEVCTVAFSGEDRGDQWPGSRVISAQKANTANAFSLPELALSTANLFTAVQPGNSLFGLQLSNPVDTAVAYGGDAAAFGQADDPMVGHRIGGVNVFGGGLALYAADGALLGAVGVSGDSSCTDHIIAWKVRDGLALDYVPAGVSPTGDDNIDYDPDSGWGHSECGLGEAPISDALPESHPVESMMAGSADMMSAADMSMIDGAESMLVRSEDGIDVTVHTSGLTDGNAYTVWAMVFNNPEACSEEGCAASMDDPAVETALFYVTGDFVEDGDDANLSGFVAAGDSSIDMMPGMMAMMGADAPEEGVGLLNPTGAEVHLILLDHGAPIEGIEEEQITTMMAGCREGENAFDPAMGPGFCPQAQVSMHLP
ncbi:MAG: heme-binding protein [Caldilineaceae bacterium]|nr:heme-binding protein [Caldilineaceae bacterium]